MRGAGPPLALAYHGLARVPLRHDSRNLFVAPRLLEKHVTQLRRWGYQFVRFSELAARAQEGAATGLVALTFDDGLVDNLEFVLPFVRARGLAATVFAVPGWLGQPHPHAPWTRLMTADEVRELARGGVEIGAHSMTHPDLTTLEYDAARLELAGSRDALEGILERPVEIAAYPYGRATPETRRACRDAGFRFACRAEGHGSWADPHDLPRESLGNGSTVLSLRLKRDPRLRPLASSRVLLSGRKAVRAWRRLREAGRPITDHERSEAGAVCDDEPLSACQSERSASDSRPRRRTQT
jgi:peptidoglycan/xylan/chitin deacetylase (PgdA/CDA1 family)